MQKSLSVLSQIESLTGNGSQKEKQELIKNNLDHEFKLILKVCFDPFLTTKLHKLDYSIDSKESMGNLVGEFASLVADLANAPAINDTLRERASNLVSNSGLDDDLKKVLAKVLTKRMNIGIGAKLINKAVGYELIPDPSLMLAEDDHKVLDKWPVIVCEEKYDGVRVICRVKDGQTSYYTRAFNELGSKYFSKISEQILELTEGLDDVFVDGELTDSNRKSVSGKVTQIMKGSPSESIGDDLIFHIFDTENCSVLTEGKGKDNYRIRRGNLEYMFKEKNFENIRMATKWEANTKDELMPIYEEIVAQGGEGVIMKDPEHVYECKRSKSWIKFKEVQDCDLIVTGWYPGEGKREDMGFIGGIICKDASGEYNVKVGSGFTESDLKQLSPQPNDLIGKIVTIQYNVPIDDKHGNKSLFLPRFIEIRSDKNEPEDLKAKFSKK